MRTWLIVASLAASIAGCDCSVCVRDSWCDGDKLMRCEVSCPRSTYKSQSFGNCVKNESAYDCAQEGSQRLGVEQTCAEATDHGQTYHQCVDKPATVCMRPDGKPLAARSSASLSCTASGRILSCFGTGSADGSGLLLTSRCDDARQTCHSTQIGLACVDDPKVSCTAALFPTCNEDAGAVLHCVGDDASGYFLKTETCVDRATICTVYDGGRPRCDHPPLPRPDAGSDAG